VLQGCQLATMRALLEQQVLPETAAVLATADRNAQVIPTTGKDRVVPRILVPLVKVGACVCTSVACTWFPATPVSLLCVQVFFVVNYREGFCAAP
jgi:hypothetical protein